MPIDNKTLKVLFQYLETTRQPSEFPLSDEPHRLAIAVLSEQVRLKAERGIRILENNPFMTQDELMKLTKPMAHLLESIRFLEWGTKLNEQ